MDLTFSTRTLSCCSLAATVFLCDEKREETSQPSSFFFFFFGTRSPIPSPIRDRVEDVGLEGGHGEADEGRQQPKRKRTSKSTHVSPTRGDPNTSILPPPHCRRLGRHSAREMLRKIIFIVMVHWDMVEYNIAIGISPRALG